MMCMRTLPLALGLAYVICCAACGGRTSGLDITGVTGAEDDTGGSGASIATGGKSAGSIGGSGASIATGGKSAGSIGGSGASIATGGKSAGSIGGGGASIATGGKSAGSTGGSGATKATGGSSAGSIGGSGATKATGGSTYGPTGGAMNVVGGSSASGGTAASGGTSSTPITSCNDTFPFLGTWEGNILDFYFDPTEAIKLELSADASGVITGKVTWGDGAPPPAPQRRGHPVSAWLLGPANPHVGEYGSARSLARVCVHHRARRGMRYDLPLRRFDIRALAGLVRTSDSRRFR